MGSAVLRLMTLGETRSPLLSAGCSLLSGRAGLSGGVTSGDQLTAAVFSSPVDAVSQLPAASSAVQTERENSVRRGRGQENISNPFSVECHLH